MNPEDVSFVKNAVYGLAVYLLEHKPPSVMFKLFDVKPSPEEIESLIDDVILEHGAVGEIYHFSGNDLEELKEVIIVSLELAMRTVFICRDEKDLN